MPSKIAEKIIKNNIIVDSFVVGEDCLGLKCITFASGGKCYCVKDLNATL
jgi:hypothetical protein